MNVLDTTKQEVIFQRPETLTEVPTHYCPGCGHGIIHRLVAEAIDDLGVRTDTIAVTSIGCSVFAYDYFNLDAIEAPHGRAPAVAAAIKRCNPSKTVFTYQGDGDLASIGTAEIVHAAARGENITVIFVNNAIYGMTGGQLAPTTPLGVRTSSTPGGREAGLAGYPIRMSEMLATLDGVAYIARFSVHTAAQVVRAKRAIKLAFQVQQARLGLALVEVLSPCPINWGVTPPEALDWIAKNMLPVFPLGDIKVTDRVKELLGEKKDA
ncbi:MAG: 2-oxoglutarate oxidoreductase [Chloroflexi bacterium]|nr:2-oxoglutarate oxidoreductase [Chloroflexota bacterium]